MPEKPRLEDLIPKYPDGDMKKPARKNILEAFAKRRLTYAAFCCIIRSGIKIKEMDL